MDGIFSGFNKEFDGRVREIWARLEEHCGLKGIRATPPPHFSWLVGEGLDFDGIKRPLAALAAETAPFEIRTSGLGLFTAPEEMVLYIAIVKDSHLLDLHRHISELTAPFIKHPAKYYYPEYWVPHISLAFDDLTAVGLSCAAPLLGNTDFHWTIPINSFEIFSQPEGETVFEHSRYKFEA